MGTDYQDEPDNGIFRGQSRGEGVRLERWVDRAVRHRGGTYGNRKHEAIAAAKAGVIGLTLSAAAMYAPRNVRVNCVAPGLVDTPQAARITSNEAALKASAAMHALGRIGRADHLASGIGMVPGSGECVGDGQVLGIDGGLV